MIIEKITIKSFGLLTDTTLEFSPTVNVIEGQNEAGKSTIAAFIRYMLYGFDGKAETGAIDERRRRINWDTGRAEGSMIVRVKDKRYLINRSTTMTATVPRPTYKEDSSIIDLETGTTAFGKSPAGEVFFGAQSDLFINTAYLGAVGDPRIDEDTVKESIENILFSGSEKINIQKAAGKIADKMETLLHKNGQGGTIHDLMYKEEALEQSLVRSDEDNRLILQKEAELHVIRERKRLAEERREKLRDLDDCYRNVMIIRSFDKLHEVESDVEEKNEAYLKFLEEHTKNHYLPDEQYRADLSLARRGVNESYRTLVEASEAYSEHRRAVGITKEIEGSIERADSLGGESEIARRAHSLRFSRIQNIALSVVMALLFITSMVVEIAATGTLATAPFRIGCAVIGVGALAAAVYFLLAQAKNVRDLCDLSAKFSTTTYQDLLGKLELIRESRSKRDNTIADIESARVAEEAAKQNYENAKRILTTVILRWGEEPPLSGLNDFLDLLEAKVDAFLERKNDLLYEKEVAELTMKDIRRSLSDMSEVDVRAKVSPLRRKVLNDINHDEILSGIDECNLEIEKQQQLAFDVENELSVLKSRAKDPGEIYEKIRLLEEQIGELQRRHKAYYVAHRAIESARDKLREEISPRLGQFSTALVGLMTDKKYEDVSVDENLAVTFKTEDGEHRSLGFLSGGTQDLFYIAVRMALIDMLYAETPPVTYDETFAHQDNDRARAMMRAIAALAKEGYQSFIFTCRQREASLALEIAPDAGVYRLMGRE